jgi:hypothetical protein
VKHRKPPTRRQRATRAAAAVSTAAGATGVLALGIVAVTPLAIPGGAQAASDSFAVTRIGALPSDAAVTRSGKPAGQALQQVQDRHRKKAAKAARAARAGTDAASRSASRTLTFSGDPRTIAASMAAKQYGWGSGQFSCLDSLWEKESSWQVHATNPTSGAYGIPQALPGSKLASAGSDWRDNAVTQIAWGLGYIKQSYGTPCSAWATSQAKGWY